MEEGLKSVLNLAVSLNKSNVLNTIGANTIGNVVYLGDEIYFQASQAEFKKIESLLNMYTIESFKQLPRI